MICLRRERNQSFAICRTVFIEGLYNHLIRYQNAFRRFEEIGAEMHQDYQSDSVQAKRLAKEPGALPEAKKSLKFGDTVSIETHENSQQMSVLLY